MNPLHASFGIPPREGWFYNLLYVERVKKDEKLQELRRKKKDKKREKKRKITISRVLKRNKRKERKEVSRKEEGDSLQHLTVLPMEFFCRREITILSMKILMINSPMECVCWYNVHR